MFILKLIQTYPFLFMIILITVWINYRCRKPNNSSDEANKAFWEKEAKANSTRRKSIDKLDYITIDEKIIPFIETNDETILSCHKEILKLKDLKIVNLTGISNTDLKLQYGVANLNILTEYDSNYTDLCRTLNTLGNRLYEIGYLNEAKQVLEFAVNTGTDVNTTFLTLAKVYVDKHEPSSVDVLIHKAKKIDSLSGNIIVKSLKQFKKENHI